MFSRKMLLWIYMVQWMTSFKFGESTFKRFCWCQLIGSKSSLIKKENIVNNDVFLHPIHRHWLLQMSFNTVCLIDQIFWTFLSAGIQHLYNVNGVMWLISVTRVQCRYKNSGEGPLTRPANVPPSSSFRVEIFNPTAFLHCISTNFLGNYNSICLWLDWRQIGLHFLTFFVVQAHPPPLNFLSSDSVYLDAFKQEHR